MIDLVLRDMAVAVSAQAVPAPTSGIARSSEIRFPPDAGTLVSFPSGARVSAIATKAAWNFRQEISPNGFWFENHPMSPTLKQACWGSLICSRL
ncbi:hypothetical protein [Mesorhizobium sp. Cs1321R2N1]|uniref:hypothetical protein n=1 Tax=Mesorhizobium sp. Cs1321R2N1 TaxID=3015174 RepID=UPI00301C19DC